MNFLHGSNCNLPGYETFLQRLPVIPSAAEPHSGSGQLCGWDRELPQQDLFVSRREGCILNGWDGLLPLSELEALRAIQGHTAP